MIAQTTQPAPAPGEAPLVTRFEYNQVLQLTSVIQPDGGSITNRYWPSGQLRHTGGARTYPVQYTYDRLGRLHTVTQGSDRRLLTHNLAGRLTSEIFLSGPLAGMVLTNQFDSLQRRTRLSLRSVDSGEADAALVSTRYDYDQRTVPGFLEVIGSAKTNATVTVNLTRAERRNEYFRAELRVNNEAGAVYQPVTNLAVLRQENGPDLLSEITGHLFLPQNPELFQYDDDGNLIRDGRWTYNWDAENRLIAMKTRECLRTFCFGLSIRPVPGFVEPFDPWTHPPTIRNCESRSRRQAPEWLAKRPTNPVDPRVREASGGKRSGGAVGCCSC